MIANTRFTLIVVVLAVLACASAWAAVTPTPANIWVTPSSVGMVSGSSFTLKATAVDGNGNPLAIKTFTWSVVPASAGTVSKGKFKAKLAGHCVVRASAGGVTGQSEIDIVAGPLKTLSIAPSTVSVPVGSQATYAVAAKDAAGNLLDTSGAIWSVKAGTGLTITQAGVVTANSVGKFSKAITVTLAKKKATASITVTPVPPATITIVQPTSGRIACGQKVGFTAECRNGAGNLMDGLTLAWTCSPAVGKLSPTNKPTVSLTAGKKPASGIVSVTCPLPGSPVAQMQVNVLAGLPKTVKVSAAPKNGLGKDETFQFTAQVLDSQGNIVSDAVVKWSLAAAAAGTIDANTGLFTAGGAPGTYSGAVVATVQGTAVKGSTNVKITPANAFYIRQVESSDYYTYTLSGSGSFSGPSGSLKFKISGSADMWFGSSWQSDWFGNTVKRQQLDIDLTISAGGDSESGSGTAQVYYTQAANGSVRYHGSEVEVMGGGGEAWVTDSPGYKVFLASPMRIGEGATWSAHLSTGDNLKGSYSIKGLEQVQVAGSKMYALKALVCPGLLGGEMTQTSWYVPELIGFAPLKATASASIDIDTWQLSGKLKMSMDITMTAQPTMNSMATALEAPAQKQEPSPLFKAVMECVKAAVK